MNEIIVDENTNWYNISKYQKLSEQFISDNSDKVYWDCISKYQKLSEQLIDKYSDKVNWYNISKYQKLSEEFINKHSDKLNKKLLEDNWNYKDSEYKKSQVVATGLYECYDDHFIAYKGIRSDRYSKYNFQYQYLANNEYEEV